MGDAISDMPLCLIAGIRTPTVVPDWLSSRLT
jgi:hypothetical protein